MLYLFISDKRCLPIPRIMMDKQRLRSFCLTSINQPSAKKHNHEITNNQTQTNIMPVFRVTVTRRQYRDGICLEPGMSVDVSTPYVGNPIVVNGGQCVVDAFMRVYGIDIKKAGGLSIGILQADRIG